MSKGVNELEALFRGMFYEKNRRMALLCRWLCIVPREKDSQNVVDVFKHIFWALVVEKTNFQVKSWGIQINALIALPNEILLQHELESFREIHQRREVYFKAGVFKYNHLLFTEEQRELLCRDFVNICFLQQTRLGRLCWPMYALTAVQRLIFKEECRNPALFDAEQVLQGLGKSHELPIYSNRVKGLV